MSGVPRTLRFVVITYCPKCRKVEEKRAKFPSSKPMARFCNACKNGIKKVNAIVY